MNLTSAKEVTYHEEYKDAKQVICRTKLAVGFTVGKTYEVKEVVVNRVQTGHADKYTGSKDEFCNFIDIYMVNDNGNLVNAAEPTDFEILPTEIPSRFALTDEV